MATRDELLLALAARYRGSGRAEKARILDEFTSVTGHHRKHAMRLLRAGRLRQSLTSRPERRVYQAAVREALIVLWEASDRICGKRLKAMIPTLLPAMERHRHLDLAPEIRAALLAISAATIDRNRCGGPTFRFAGGRGRFGSRVGSREVSRWLKSGLTSGRKVTPTSASS